MKKGNFQNHCGETFRKKLQGGTFQKICEEKMQGGKFQKNYGEKFRKKF